MASLTHSQVSALTVRLMDELGEAHVGRPLREMGWTFAFDRARRRLGACHGRTKQITLSRHLATSLDAREVEDTIRHEIAHALDVVTRGWTAHDAVWKQWATRCGATPTRCYSGDLPTDADALYRCVCPDCGHTAARHRQPVHALICTECRKSKRRVYLRVTHRDSSRVIWPGGDEMGPYGGSVGVSATCPNCGRLARAARMPKRPQACKTCCDQLAGGRFDGRYELNYSRPSRR